MIIIIDFFLMIVTWFIYQNIRKQIELSKIKADFISNVSHEIRTPLSLIRMYIETLEFDRLNNEKKRKQYYKVIAQETERLTSMVNKILNFSQIENNKRKYVFNPTNLNKIAETVSDTFRFHLESKKFELKLDIDNSLKPIFADSEAVTDAVFNLLDNAVKYSGNHKSIRIVTGSQKG